MKGARTDLKQPTDNEQEILGAAPLPAAQITDTGAALSGAAVVFGALLILGALLVGASAVPPRRVPWPVVADPLVAHRSDLATLGIGVIAIAFLYANAAILL
ncbi:MAG TPA: hypothetical protein VFL41_13390 [Gaiellaceae bacterium]|nr:hypothetical protein [Gaiellaceae bacterium]HET8653629.1 hypothetical protein [Gaiellaceae bacterium]